MKYTITILFFILSFIIQGQTFNGGILTGLNFSRLHEVGLRFKKAGITFGGKTEVEILKNIFSEMQIIFNQKGHIGWKDSLGILDWKMKTNYIEVPLLIHYKIKSNIKFGTGLSIGKLIKYQEYIYENEVYKLNTINKKDYSLVFSGTYYFTKHLAFNMIYTHQLNDIRKQERSTCVGIRINYNFIKMN